jgi:hypothetical protein
LPGCFSPISSRFHHGHKLLITDATILWENRKLKKNALKTCGE